MNYDYLKTELACAYAALLYILQTPAYMNEKGERVIAAPPEDIFIRDGYMMGGERITMKNRIPELAKLIEIKELEIKLQIAKDRKV